MSYGIEAEGGLFKKVRVKQGEFSDVTANNLVANDMRGDNVRIGGIGQFTDLSVTRNRVVRFHHHLSDGNVKVYSGAWNMSGDLDIRFGCVQNCSGSCTGQCTGCSGSCSGSCTARCSNNCSGCSGGCSGGCTTEEEITDYYETHKQCSWTKTKEVARLYYAMRLKAIEKSMNYKEVR